MSDPCAKCGGSGLVDVEVHAEGCRPIRCAPGCPRTDKRECPACAKAALGTELTG